MAGCRIASRRRRASASPKNLLAQARAVESPVRSEHPRAKGVDHGGERRLSRLDDLPRDDVGVDHRDAVSCKKVLDGGLAAGDAAGQCYPKWSNPLRR